MKPGYVRYEMILAWSTPKRPFVTQKLQFPAPAKFHLAYREAKYLKDLLWKSGGLKKSAVRLLSVAVAGVLEEYQQEHAPWLRRRDKEMREIARKAKSFDSKIAKKYVKESKKKLKEPELKFTIDPLRKVPKTKVKPKPVKVAVAPPPKPMIDATRPRKKAK